MSELCAVHKIVAAPDGRCVLCRRPKLAFINNDEEESVGSKTFTALLGLGLLATMGFAAYTSTVPSANASTATRARAIATQSANVSAKQANEQPEIVAEAAAPALPNPPIEVSTVTKPTAEAAPKQLESSKRKRMRTVGKRIVDPRLIEARKSVRVTMYSAPWCFICDRARSFLEAREVELVDYNVDLDADAEKRLEQLNPTASIPTFIVDGKTIVGFHPWGLEDAIDAVAQENYCVQSGMHSDKGAVCERWLRPSNGSFFMDQPAPSVYVTNQPLRCAARLGASSSRSMRAM